MTKVRPRTIVTTDGEIDDINSFIRLLLYTNDLDVAGIILTSSKFHYSGTADKPAYRWTGTTWIPEMIERYATVYPNLIKHDPNYPSPDHLHSLYHIGNIADVGDMAEETDGSNHMVSVLLDDNPQPVYIQTWGGTNTTARALKTIQERYEGTPEWPAIKKKVEDKAVLYIILNQDDTYEQYIAKHWDLTIVNDYTNFGFFAYVWRYLPEKTQAVFQPEWFKKQIKNKGALLDQYALIGDGHYLEGEPDEFQFGTQDYLDKHPEVKPYSFISEGDSPSYFYLLAQGLRGFEHPTYGGWGGRFDLLHGKTYGNKTADYNPETGRFETEYSIARWIPDIQADFAARANWCVAERFDQAVHYPEFTEQSRDISVQAGQTITLSDPASDPNGFPLTYKWSCYYEASSYWDLSQVPLQMVMGKLGDMEIPIAQHSEPMLLEAEFPMAGSDSSEVTFTIPADAQLGDTFHILLEVANQAETPLKSYQRYILIVA
ncbi:DUF1593 domain-containing protein [Streptococcus ovuberis]|uniref:DUF1593 domain-containing protein n=1 Tax=Streptococcus ovuberis TaxID=1936207 RepID=A0A7X6S069_9STRE|nr:DUF1593 domain-containing protein [Streptococcus ovuberis]NKZ19908.1 DUF1593 domain-containing protein [Streptococcus ovuberis]